MKLRKLSISSFRSFKAMSRLDFSQEPGFALLTGQNLQQPELGANGSGKSTVWEALVWVLFGKTSRGLKAGALQPWGSSSPTHVLLEFEVRGSLYTLLRTWNPNTLALGNSAGETRVVKQEEVESLIGFDYGTFLNTVLIGQFTNFFFDLSAAEKLAVFSSILGLDRWVKASDAAKVAVRSCELQVSSLESRVRSNKEYIADAEVSIKRAREDSAVWAGKQKDSIEQHATALEFLAEQSAVLEAAVNAAIDAHSKSLDHAKQIEKELIAADKSVEFAASIAEAKSNSQNQAAKLQELEKRRKAIASLSGTCSRCEQIISPEHVQSHLAECEKEIESQSRAVADAASKYKHLLEVQEQNRASIRELSLKHESAVNKEREAARVFAEERRKRDRNESEIKNARALIAQKQAEVDPFLAVMKTSEERIEKYKAELAKNEQDLAEVRKKMNYATFWAAKFKELRLWLIEESLQQLEVEVNNSMMQLGLSGWQVKFDVERENTSGGVTKGFQVLITSPQHEDPIPWEAWSGGETQRLRIAGAVGLSSLIRARTGATCNIEVWDEPTAHLSEEGINDLLAFFDNRQRDQGIQIWLVDHRSLDYGGFTNEYTVVKDDSGSSIRKGRSLTAV